MCACLHVFGTARDCRATRPRRSGEDIAPGTQYSTHVHTMPCHVCLKYFSVFASSRESGPARCSPICIVLPYLVLPCLVLPSPVLFCPALSSLVLFCPVLSCLVSPPCVVRPSCPFTPSCPVCPSCRVLYCPVLSCPVLLSCPALPCHVLHCPLLFFPVLTCPLLSCRRRRCRWAGSARDREIRLHYVEERRLRRSSSNSELSVWRPLPAPEVTRAPRSRRWVATCRRTVRNISERKGKHTW